MRAFKFRIYPTLKQRRQLEREFQSARFVWNWALDLRTWFYQEHKVNLNWIGLSSELTVEKEFRSFLKNSSSTVLSNVLRNQEEAFKKFFRRETRYPKFKKPYSKQSCTYQLDKRRGDKIFVSGKLLQLPKLGNIKVRWTEDIPVFPNNATVSKTPSGTWFVSLQAACVKKLNVKATTKSVGIDLGIHSFITTSTGDKTAPPRPYKKSRRKLKLVQRRLSKKTKGSSNRRKSRLKVARLHQRIGDQRRDFLHKLSTTIVKEHLTVAIEDLGVRGLANGKLASAVVDCGWGEFIRQLGYKAEWNSRILLKLPRYERSTGVCPRCGSTGDKLPLNVRTWKCNYCNSVHDRDVAAAEVILLKTTARSAGSKVCGAAQPSEAEENSFLALKSRYETETPQLWTTSGRRRRPLKRASIA